jgi:Rrf2 family protein
MSRANLQFAVAVHVMAALGAHHGEEMRSCELALSVNADGSFVRRVISKLAKAGLVSTTRGKAGACCLARPPAQITLLDIYRASEAPAAFTFHDYPVTKQCQVSRHIKHCMEPVLDRAQDGFEQVLARETLADVVERIKQEK